uniref:Uncharacterized protein n=1 Tax=Solanum tuberosum TaxID=4113 RepID=M0ZYW6_SOLTU
MVSINLEREWIGVLEYNAINHVEKQDTDVFSMNQETFEDVHTGNLIATIKEIKEVDSEQGVSRAIYANSENFRESNEGDVLEVEISDQSLAITRSIVCLDQTLEANGETVDQIDGEADLQGQISAVR